MKSTFWHKLKKPFFVLAPMADVTDGAFRRIIAKYGKPDVLWTEFVSADGLASKGRENLLVDLSFTPKEKPIVAQIFSSNPDAIRKTAALVKKLKFDGLDINMGCPDRKVEKSGAGAALIKDFKKAKEIIQAAKEGAGPNLPVSVKTRIGYKEDVLDEWLVNLLEEEPAAVTIHGRTRKEMSLVPARWDAIARAVEIRDGFFGKKKIRTLIIGNGDVKNLKEAGERAKESGVDGVMIGRGIFGNPWLFNKRRKIEPSREEKLKVMLEHTLLFDKLFRGKKSFDVMKKHFKAYVNGFDGARELRNELYKTKTASEVKAILSPLIK
ncbi:MAG: tRNA dihydrouridine synthase [Candidatus Saccharibacteria bacterium]